jgi:hypothetical protein
METLGASHPSLWMHDNLLEQQSLQQRSFPEPPVDRFAGFVSERMHSEVVSLGHNRSALGLHAEVPCTTPSHTTPLTAAPDFKCPFYLSWIMFLSLVWNLCGFEVPSIFSSLLTAAQFSSLANPKHSGAEVEM